MTIFHHVSVACPACGEVQIVEVKSSDQAVLCGDCGIGGIVNFHGNAENRKMVIVWGFGGETRPMPMSQGSTRENQ